MAKVSVIVTFHNEEDYVSEALLSLIHQTLDDIEIVAVEDSSTDGTLKQITRMAETDPRIRVLQSHAKSCSLSRNMGMREATGEYVAFVDGDDLVDHDFYEQLYTAATSQWSGGADGARAGYTSFRDSFDNRKDDRFCEIVDQRVADGFLLSSWDNSNVVWNAIYKRATLFERNCAYFKEFPRTAEDLFWTLRTCHRLRTIVPVGKVRYHHRMGKPGQRSSVTLQNVLDVIKANQQGVEYFHSVVWQNEDEYFHQYERLLWRYTMWEERLRRFVEAEHEDVIATRKLIKDAFSAGQHRSAFERMASMNWWPDLMDIVEG